MADGTSAAERLERLLHILPAASAEGGVSFASLARDLDVDEATILADLTEVTSRSYYHPARSGDDIQISLDADRVSIWTKGAFRRPVRLSPLEAFCLALGLRRRDAAAPSSEDRDDLLRRVESHLATEAIPAEPMEGFHATDAAPDPDGVRDVLAAGARDRSPCRISYLKPSDPEPEERVIHPYALAHAEGRWYAVGWCERAEGARAFRLDRVLHAEPSGGTFEPREEVDVDAFVGSGRVYRADEETEVVVRYSPEVARWVAEWAADADGTGDGGLEVRHRVADPGWVVRHVLAYGGEAEVVAPPEVREAVGRYVGRSTA